MVHSCCVPLCHGKGYRTATVDRKQVKISFHKFSDASKGNVVLRHKWIHEIHRDVGTLSCSCFSVANILNSNSFLEHVCHTFTNVTQHEKIGLMCTKYTPSHYSVYPTFIVSYVRSVNCNALPKVSCTTIKSFIS